MLNYSESRVPESGLLESGFAAVSDGDDTWSTELTGAKRVELQESLSEVPRYEGNPPGYYVRFDGAIYRINVLIYD